jgi:hypothetical protein
MGIGDIRKNMCAGHSPPCIISHNLFYNVKKIFFIDKYRLNVRDYAIRWEACGTQGEGAGSREHSKGRPSERQQRDSGGVRE